MRVSYLQWLFLKSTEVNQMHHMLKLTLSIGTFVLTILVPSSLALAVTYTTSGERTPAEIQRNVSECLDRLKTEPLASEICNAEQNLPGNLTGYKPINRKTFVLCLNALPHGKHAVQSRAICADNDVTNRGHVSSGHNGHLEIQQ